MEEHHCISEEQLLDIELKWRKELDENLENVFVNDGILNLNIWNNSEIKIMFLLKESYGKFKSIRNNALKVREGNGPNFFRNILYWKYAINKVYNTKYDKLNDDNFIGLLERFPEWEKNSINDIAYFNIKKILGKPSSNYNDIFSFAKKHKSLLKEHIDIINPKFIFTNSTTYNCYLHIYDLKNLTGSKLNRGQKSLPKIYLHQNRIIILFYHPSYRKSYKSLYQDLLNQLNIINN